MMKSGGALKSNPDFDLSSIVFAKQKDIDTFFKDY